MNYTSIEQSKKLLELGLSPESADMYYLIIAEDEYSEYPNVGNKEQIAEEFPCWSVGALRQLFPVGIKFNEETYLFGDNNRLTKDFAYYYSINDNACVQFTGSDIECAYNMIVWLLENNYIN